MIGGGIHIAQERGDIGFEKTIADNHQGHRYIQHSDIMDTHHAIAHSHQQATHDDGTTVTQVAVSDQSAEEGSKKHQGDKRTIKTGGFFFIHIEPMRRIFQVKGENADHQVVAKTFPHFRKE